ncbi:non-ribosomal peptide synthetase [Herbidospora cretacea]|uniref:non-ribosomal peptide synthetase n=1 Tax=Herbidospora cretacea TaxID=28444 RepID=UPI00068C48A8|nr:non-ribosomal peptide synthetase [Herbidospora cretacea]
METALPLARPGGDPAVTHERRVEAPGRALIALLHRYTGETEIAGSHVTGDMTVGEIAARLPVTIGPLSFDGVTLRMRGTDFDADAADQYAAHLGRFLDPAAKVRDVEVLTPEETERMLVAWNQTDEPVPAPYFHERVAEIAQATPHAPAVVWPGGTMTFRQLDDDANRLAHRLTTLGVRPGDRVGTCFPRGPESLIAQLACFKAGAAAILLDPDFPADRVQFMIVDGAAKLTLTMDAHRDVVTGHVVTLDGDDWRRESPAPINSAVAPDDLIHVCYTSGSTGKPKAVMVRHGAARNLIYSMRTICGVTPSSRGTWLAAPGYGMVEVECFSVLAAGAPVHIPEPSVVTSPEWLRDWLVRSRITHTLLMKAMCERLWDLEWPAGTALRNIRICGERVQSWPLDLPFHVFNLYGSAEATVVATCDITELGRELGERERARRLPPIGRPTPNVRTYVLDERLRPVPPGVVGELCVAGESLSSGYLNRPEATAEKWVSHELGTLYRTGDLARFWTDGSIEIVGRTDNQVKVRGNRVHLGEIEVVIAAQPGVRQAAVLARQDTSGDTRLVAYVEGDPSIRDLRRALSKLLPSFMVPSAYVVGRFPLTVNGKIDRNALPEPPKERPDVDSPYEEPRTDVEHTLRDLWATTLDLDGIGVKDNFFDLGGDSMRAAALTDRIRARFETDADIDDLFDDPTIERMAVAIAAK